MRLFAVLWGAATAVAGVFLGVWLAELYVQSRGEVYIHPSFLTAPLGYITGALAGTIFLARRVKSDRTMITVLTLLGSFLPVVLAVLVFSLRY